MRLTVMAIVLLLSPVGTGQSALVLPTVTPFFMSREVEGGPAFLVECRNNTTNLGISSGSDAWALTRSAIRIDGTVLDEHGRIGPGLTVNIPPGGMWRGIIELRQTASGASYAIAMGANVRMPTLVPLNAGRHTISVRCTGVWSADLSFYWEK